MWLEQVTGVAALVGLLMDLRGSKMAMHLVPWAITNPIFLWLNWSDGRDGHLWMFIGFTVVTWWEFIRRLIKERSKLR